MLSRSDTSRSELAELSKQANPDEIDIDDDDEDEDESQGPDGEWHNSSKTKSNGDCLNIYEGVVLFVKFVY